MTHTNSAGFDAALEKAAHALVYLSRALHARGWMPATAGNLSCVVARDPLLLALTASSVPKGSLAVGQIVLVDADGRLARPSWWKPSAETLLHTTIASKRDAGFIVHTHSIWATLLSDRYANAGGVSIAGFELAKALSGVHTHDHAEWVPILENSQDMRELSVRLAAVLDARPDCHGVLLRGHGLYTWGKDASEAERHAEALEFLFEVVGRRAAFNPEKHHGNVEDS